VSCIGPGGGRRSLPGSTRSSSAARNWPSWCPRLRAPVRGSSVKVRGRPPRRVGSEPALCDVWDSSRDLLGGALSPGPPGKMPPVSDTWDDSERELGTVPHGRHAARAALCLALLRAARPRWAGVVDAFADGKKGRLGFRPLAGGRPSFVLVEPKGRRGVVSSVRLTLQFFPVPPNDPGSQDRATYEAGDALGVLEKLLVRLTTPAG
jgi:hypothetical protein